jgi:hypothetical protein
MMLTPNEDHNNLRALLANIGHTDEKIVQAIVAVSLTLDSFDLTVEERQIVTDLVGRDGDQAIRDFPLFGEDAWMSEFDYGNDKVGAIVRVKPDAYDSPTGKLHNGLVGVLLSLSGYKADVSYIGLASGNQMRHPKENLQSLRHGVK